jgi:hypothetical protein
MDSRLRGNDKKQPKSGKTCHPRVGGDPYKAR